MCHPSQGRSQRAVCGNESDLFSPESSTHGRLCSRLRRPCHLQASSLVCPVADEEPALPGALYSWFCGTRVPGWGASRRWLRLPSVPCRLRLISVQGWVGGDCAVPLPLLADTWSMRQSGCRGLPGRARGGAHRALHILSRL